MEIVSEYYHSGKIRKQYPKSGIAGTWKSFDLEGELIQRANYNEEGQFHGEYFSSINESIYISKLYFKNDLSFGQQKYIQK